MKGLIYILLFLLPVAPAGASFDCSRGFRSLLVHRADYLPTIEKRLNELEEKAATLQGPERYKILEQMNRLFTERAKLGRGYKTIPLLKIYRKENIDQASSIRYLSPRESAEREAIVENKLLYRKDGSLLDTKDKIALFVMDADGRIYLIDPANDIRHSSILAGRPVASAGEIIVKEGRVEAISNWSGHYWPTMEIFRQVLREIPVHPSKVQQRSLRGF